MFINLHDVPTSESWFPNKYIEAEIKNKLDKTGGQLSSYEMENEIRHYIESLNNDPQWVRIITNDINKLLVDREYIDFFVKIYMQWSKDNGYTSSNQKLIIECLPHFDKLALLPFKVYIEVETMTRCYVCDNFQKSIFIRSTKVKEGFFCILQMLRMHTGLLNWNKNNVYDKHFREINPIGIDKPCIKIAKSELLFENV